MEDLAAFGAFPVDDLRDGLFIAGPRLVSFRIEIEDVSFVMAARQDRDPLALDQSFQRRVFGPDRGR